jgi:hypothetical protein
VPGASLGHGPSVLFLETWKLMTHRYVSAPITLGGKTYPLGKVTCSRCGQGLDAPWFKSLFCWRRRRILPLRSHTSR